jgi:hypothetical protein
MKIYLFVIISFVGLAIKAQPQVFKVDCGNDTSFCEKSITDTTLHIGSQIKILNGVAPYKYIWTCKPYKPSTNLTFTASDFLNDTSIINPFIKEMPVYNKPWCFYLIVEDSNSNVAIDSILIQYSQFIFYTFEYSFDLHLGDSIQFFYEHFVDGGIPPVKYYWTPTIGLEDSARIDTWCKPQQTTFYYQYIIDSAGCKSELNRAYLINILTTSVNDNSYKSSTKLNLHIEGKRLIFNNLKNEVANLSIYSIDGKKLYYAQTFKPYFDIPILHDKRYAKICVLNLSGKIATLKIY